METKTKLPQQIIGLYSSVAGSGKSTVARMLHSRGYERVSFADPLKNMAYSLFVDLGMNTQEAFGAITENKGELIPRIGVTGRHVLRTLGTEWGRDCIHPELWLRCWETQIKGYPKAVADDVRFPNEAKLIKSKGGQLWRIIRPGHTNDDGEHASEGGLDDWEFDQVIVNDSGLAELATTVFDAISTSFTSDYKMTSRQEVRKVA
jgi:hypothetical protein